MLKTATLTKLAEALSKLELIQEIDQLKAEVDSHRPISREIQDRIFQKFRLDWNYNSNAIEGNKLTYGETVALLMHGVTAKGKPLKDHMDVKGHNEGINLLLDIVKSERDFTQNDIRSLHEIILVEAYSSKTVTSEGIPATRKISIGQYKTAPNHVKTPTGEMHYYASPAETPALMDELMVWYEAAKKNDNIHPFITASLFHHRFVSIHPFDDGNGRMTRLLMNLILMRNQYPLIVVPMKLREEYYGVLSQADVNEFEPLIAYFRKLLKHSLEIQLKGIKGENISEPDDIDKEIELLKVSLNAKKNIIRRDEILIWEIIKNQVYPIFKSFHGKCKQLDDLFEKNNYYIKIADLGENNNKIQRNVDLKQFKSLIEKNTIIFLEISILYSWIDFKKHMSSFDLNTGISFQFAETYYSYKKVVKGGTLQEVRIKYDSVIDKIESQKLIENKIEYVINKIKSNISN